MKPLISRLGFFIHLFLTTLLATAISADEPKKVALLIGVENYQKKGFGNLNYSEDDVTAVAKVLKAQGFDTTVMLGSANGKLKATKANIVAQINDEFIPSLENLDKTDIALVMVAGHGRHESTVVGQTRREDHFYCPADAHDKKSDTWISISKLINDIESNSGSERNLILIDACRDNPSRGRGVDGKGFTLNRDAIGVLFASSYNEQAYEPDELKHGLFTYYVLEGLNGDAANRDDEVTWDSLVGYVKGRVDDRSRELEAANKIAGIQRPNAIGNLRGKSPVLAVLSVEKKSTAKSDAKSKTESEKNASAESEKMSAAKAGKKPDEEKANDSKVETGKTSNARSITNSIRMKLNLIPAGKFMMGSPKLQKGRRGDEIQHEVEITTDLYIGTTEVTQGQWKAVMGTEPWKFFKSNVKDGPDYPATFVSWDDAVEFCRKLSARDGETYRLPTEAEWEYACRGGSNTAYSFGDSPDELGDYGWITKNAQDVGAEYAHAVGKTRTNSFGLYDMHGNVVEWCSDWYDWSYYKNSSKSDPLGPSVGSERVNRGGSWSDEAKDCRSSSRDWDSPSYRSNFLGFRVVCELEQE